MKVLHLPTSVGGNSWGLSSGEKNIGLDSYVLIKDRNKYKYPTDIHIDIKKSFFLFRLPILIKTFLKIKDSFDVFHFNFGTSLIDFYYLGLPILDIPFYPKNKKIFFTFNGTDARGWTYKIYKDEISKELDSNCRTISLMWLRKMMFSYRVKKISKYANHIFAVNPDLLHYLPSKSTFLPYTIANWDSIDEVPFDFDYKDIKIVHAPSSRGLKGTKHIIKAVKILQKQYENIEFILVENLSQNEALEIYKTADIVIDQIFLGWYGAFGVEVMKMGKPLAVFIREEDLRFIPKDMKNDLKNTVININQFTIVETLEKYINDKNLLKSKSKAGLKYVNRWHHPNYVAGIVKKIYEDS